MPARPIVLPLLLVLFGGCAGTPRQAVTIDGSTPASFRASWTKLNASLSGQQQAELNGAILLLGATQFHHQQGPPSFGPETLRADLDGKGFDAIISAARATGASFSVDSRSASPPASRADPSKERP